MSFWKNNHRPVKLWLNKVFDLSISNAINSQVTSTTSSVYVSHYAAFCPAVRAFFRELGILENPVQTDSGEILWTKCRIWSLLRVPASAYHPIRGAVLLYGCVARRGYTKLANKCLRWPTKLFSSQFMHSNCAKWLRCANPVCWPSAIFRICAIEICVHDLLTMYKQMSGVRIECRYRV